MSTTSIEWTDRTWNPMRGCRRVSPGCEHCYAERSALRQATPRTKTREAGGYHGLVQMTKKGPRWTGKARFAVNKLYEPLSLRKPQRFFVNSMSDLFYEGFSFEEIAAVFGVMAAADRHTFQILTKRPERAIEFFNWLSNLRGKAGGYPPHVHLVKTFAMLMLPGRKVSASASIEWPLPNVWIGVSVESQKYADERIPLLLQIPAAVHFLSMEPLLGAVLLRPEWLMANNDDAKVDLAIVGGESGPGARPCDVAWIRSIVEQCAAAKTACFVKQLGAQPHQGDGGAGWADSSAYGVHWRWDDVRTDPISVYAQYSRKGGDMAEWPEDLRVRQMPKKAA